MLRDGPALAIPFIGMVKPPRQPAYCGRPENSTANSIGLATLIVRLVNVDTR